MITFALFMPVQRVIDGFEFARSAGAIEGRLAVAGFTRLVDSLADSAGFVDFAIHGVLDASGRPALRVAIRGSLRLSCRRCLGVLEHPVAVESTLVLAATQDEIDAAPYAEDAPERVLASRDMRVAELVEDELLLEIPLAPRHARCGARERSMNPDGHASPFAGLRGLMQDKDVDGARRR